MVRRAGHVRWRGRLRVPVHTDRPFACAGIRRQAQHRVLCPERADAERRQARGLPGPARQRAALPAVGQWAVGVIVTVLAMLFMAAADLFVQRWMWWSIGAAKPAGRRVRGAHVR
jgi:hypothetical protein